ncbi:hypothetical protein BH24ACT26_BH24ACT26_02450 [soil metagenome]
MRSARLKRRSALVGVAASVFVLAASALAWACTSLATLETNPSSAEPGDKVTLTGENYDPSGSKVAIHFNTLQGNVLTTAKAQEDGSMKATLTVPKEASGQYVLIATQTGEKPSDGMAFGLPARAAFTVGAGAAAETAGQAGGAQPQPGASSLAPESSSSSSWVLLGVLGAVALALFGAGLASFMGEVRRRDVGATVPAGRR